MTIQHIFSKPLERPINGVVKADQADDATVYQELDEYVITKELERHFRDFFNAYKTAHNDPSLANRMGVWISGFFGSGKSHFLKVLSYLLGNIEARDASGNTKQAIDFFDANKVEDPITRADITQAAQYSTDVILFNIDSKASSNDDGNPILNVFLRVFNEHLGFSGDSPHIAHMERYLNQRGIYQAFKEAFKESSGSSWEEERDAPHFYQDDIEAALSKALNISLEAANKWFENAEKDFSVSVENFCKWVKEHLDSKPANHRVLFLVDEVGQFIGQDSKLMLNIQTITENLGTICNGRAWIIVTSQADMDAVIGDLSASKANDFSKITGRFTTRLSLSSSNTDEVIQKRLLRKTDAAKEQLDAIWQEKGDILRNQINFDKSGPTLKNYDSVDTFIAHYPFIPYQFQLVQKVFEQVRKVGASGAHLAYGERSMLDAFQMAALSIKDKPVGALIPMHSFYNAIEGFLDTAVKRTIDQARENTSLEAIDVHVLRTLFMIRYVDLIKGTLDNLVTLSLTEIDQDKLALRKQIEASLQRLEKESLIIRNGEEYLFLTNEERDISRQIKAVDITSSEENRALSDLLFKDLLKDRNKYRYPENKTDYSIGRFLDGHTVDGRHEHALKVEFISPLDPDYESYTEAACINKSSEAQGSALFKLPDNKDFYTELRTWLRTNRFIRLNDDTSQAELSRILADRGRENLERKKRLNLLLEEMVEQAKSYALGQILHHKSTNITMQFDEACRYVLENTYTKLNYLQVLQDNPDLELRALLQSDDIAQADLELDGEEGNAAALREMDEFIKLRTTGDARLAVPELIDRFSQRPYGWPDGEILLLIARLAVADRIVFHAHGSPVSMPLTEAYEPLTNSRKRRELIIQRKRQTDEQLLKQARELSRELFSQLGPQNEKDLFEFYKTNFQVWLNNLERYLNQMAVSHFPGKELAEPAKKQLQRLLALPSSVDFFTALVDNKADYLDLEEDYRDLHEFFENQQPIWNALLDALRAFSINKAALVKVESAKKALAELERIAALPSPYSVLHTTPQLIETVQAVQQKLIQEKRDHALKRLEEKAAQLNYEISNTGLNSAHISNQVLRPLHELKEQIANESSIAQIYLAQTQTADDLLHNSLELLRTHAEAELARRRQREAAAATTTTTTSSPTNSGPAAAESPVTKPTVIAPKPVFQVSAVDVFSALRQGMYIETTEEMDQFIDALKAKLKSAIEDGKRVQIR